MRIVITITIAKSILYLMLDVRFQMSLILLQNISHNAFAFLREHNHTSIPILSYPILSYPILSYPILSYLKLKVRASYTLSSIRPLFIYSAVLHLLLFSLLRQTLFSLRIKEN